MSAQLWCRLCRKAYPAGAGFCPVDRSDLVTMPKVDGQSTGREEEPDRPVARTVCWNCGHRSPNPRNESCLDCKMSLIPPALVIRFHEGQIVLNRNTSAELGREGVYGHLFERNLHVSRRHAIASVDEQGGAWIRPVHTAPNGTFVNDEEIHDETALQSGDEVRLAGTATGSVGLIRRPASE